MSNSNILSVALVQTDIYWKDKSSNLSMLEEKIWSIRDKVDLIILPEMFNTGFSMDVEELAEHMNFNTGKWMRQMASQTGSVITGSLIIKDSDYFYNRLLWVTPEGDVKFYDKKHLFGMANEDQHFSPGMDNIILSLKGWNIRPQICYDLRFPVWSRNKGVEGMPSYDMIFFVASWPSPRISAWDALLKARAIENQSYAVGVNRIGVDGNDIPYVGHTSAYDFKGDPICFLSDREEIAIIHLDKQALEKSRAKFPFLKDGDKFVIEE
ncbi:nitrilase family protein [Anditalea andensis]|uniref:Omega-amidase YafV n=1 Tax=Anditalea andensis TaxID=1048983 RepID=A0A074KX53_9BACT|nr:nitrilase family protein [Anditalea andensis]KEO72810.1 amidohydrolase [Anditalea andensis]